MVRRLKTDGYVSLAARSVSLTAKGRSRAESVVRKHRLAERLLTDVIGLEWHKAHDEAGRWEHVISDEVEARLIELLGHPSTCPHGNPIPGAKGKAPAQVALADAEPGDHIRLERVTEQVEIDLESLSYLSSHGFVPGTGARVQAKETDGSVTLVLDDLSDDATIELGPSITQQLFVAEV
jgi:DtxR family Mn-dependent transcriptional regulator